ncbi:MAG: glycoside hydrolase family 97 catalytic domain-containing protein, partial [Bacteroidaceae bacterium]|nr:glycoside hydrolase family 97 catalytic domain-containing protein [Bacteroidaceae bacterium]
ESTLVTDVAEPAKIADTSWIQSGVASWIYWAYNHGSQDYQLVNKYTDLAKSMGWPYTLIDAEWDVMKNGGTMEDAVKYACQQGIKPMIWYNSDANWTGASAPTPQGRINTPENCDKEFAYIKKLGVSGIKVDFFKNDNTWSMNKYLDLLEAASKHKLQIVFHGCTVPRGWQRTYPNLMTCEAVYGAEWYNNLPTLTEKAAAHNATLPFTRNVVGSMDYTPGTFTDSQHPHITTHGHELALPILFESGIQHMPDRPESYLSMPNEVKQLLSTLPTAWDDTKLLGGYPGDYAVIARQKGNIWYIAGVNGKDEEQTIAFKLNSLSSKNKAFKAEVFTEGSTNNSFKIISKTINRNDKITMKTPARGGFVIVLKQN